MSASIPSTDRVVGQQISVEIKKTPWLQGDNVGIASFSHNLELSRTRTHKPLVDAPRVAPVFNVEIADPVLCLADNKGTPNMPVPAFSSLNGISVQEAEKARLIGIASNNMTATSATEQASQGKTFTYQFSGTGWLIAKEEVQYMSHFTPVFPDIINTSYGFKAPKIVRKGGRSNSKAVMNIAQVDEVKWGSSPNFTALVGAVTKKQETDADKVLTELKKLTYLDATDWNAKWIAHKFNRPVAKHELDLPAMARLLDKETTTDNLKKFIGAMLLYVGSENAVREAQNYVTKTTNTEDDLRRFALITIMSLYYNFWIYDIPGVTLSDTKEPRCVDVLLKTSI